MAVSNPRRQREVHGRLASVVLLPAIFLAFVSIGLVSTLLGGGLRAQCSGGSAYAPSESALSDVPGNYLALYTEAAERHGIDWSVLAAIGKVESGHGRSTKPGVRSGLNFAGCCAGPMQFNVRDGTWAGAGLDGNGDGRRDPYDPRDAIPSAARKLASQGAPGDYRRALLAYNNSETYVAQVLELAGRYRGAARTDGGLPTALPALSAGEGGCLGGAQLALAQGSGEDVLAHPRISVYPGGQADLRAGIVDPRVTGLLLSVAAEHTVVISSLRSGHSLYTAGANVSNHADGRAADISAVDGRSCRDTARGSPCGRLAIQLGALAGEAAPEEVIYCFDPGGGANSFAAADHCDHIHVGFRGAGAGARQR